MKQVNWGVIGTGDVMEVKSGPGLYKAENSNLCAVFNRHIDKANGYAARHGVKLVCKSAKELIQRDDVDVVYIATPPVSHKHYAIQVLEAGKIPYIEKPLAMNYAEAAEIKALADEKNLPVYVAYYRRGNAKFIKIKQLLENGVIGNVRGVSVQQTATVDKQFLDNNKIPWRVQPAISGGGLFMDIGSHVLDGLMLFFGEFESMYGYASNSGGYYLAEDTVMASFKFQNGVAGVGQWCFSADETKNEVTLIGDKGRLIYDALSVKRFKTVIAGKEQVYQFDQPEHIAMPYQQSVINELLGKGTSNANFNHAVNLAQMMDGVLAPYYQN